MFILCPTFVGLLYFCLFLVNVITTLRNPPIHSTPSPQDAFFLFFIYHFWSLSSLCGPVWFTETSHIPHRSYTVHSKEETFKINRTKKTEESLFILPCCVHTKTLSVWSTIIIHNAQIISVSLFITFFYNKRILKRNMDESNNVITTRQQSGRFNRQCKHKLTEIAYPKKKTRFSFKKQQAKQKIQWVWWALCQINSPVWRKLLSNLKSVLKKK